MKLFLKHLLQAKSCSLVAATFALATIAASTVAAGQVRVFNKRVSGVPVASPEVIADNVFSEQTGRGCSSRSNTAKTICLKYLPSTDRD
jgi:hypothetical protein